MAYVGNFLSFLRTIVMANTVIRSDIGYLYALLTLQSVSKDFPCHTSLHRRLSRITFTSLSPLKCIIHYCSFSGARDPSTSICPYIGIFVYVYQLLIESAFARPAPRRETANDGIISPAKLGLESRPRFQPSRTVISSPLPPCLSGLRCEEQNWIKCFHLFFIFFFVFLSTGS